MTSAIEWLVTPAVALPSTEQIVQLLAALMIPVGLFFVVTKRGDERVKWRDLLVAVGIFVLPALVILGIQGVLSPALAALVIGIVIGHVMAMLDTDRVGRPDRPAR